MGGPCYICTCQGWGGDGRTMLYMHMSGVGEGMGGPCYAHVRGGGGDGEDHAMHM